MEYYVELHSGKPEEYVLSVDRLGMFVGEKVLSAKDGRAKLKASAMKELRKLIKRNDTVYCILRNVSRSGMSRQIDFLILDNKGPRFISGHIANALGYSQTDGGALKVNGCGMDMGFHVINNLSMAIFCPDKYDHDAAFSLKHSWL